MAKKPTTPVSPTETKGQKFSRLATQRVTKAHKSIMLIGNLSGNGYEHTPDQLAKIGKVLKEAVDAMLLKFNKEAKKEADKIAI